MADGHEPVPLVVAVGGHVGVTDRERLAAVLVDELRRAVPLGIVGVAVGAVEGEPVAGTSLRAAARAVASLVVGIRLAGEAGGEELIGGVEREAARALGRRHARHPAGGVVDIAVGDARACRRRMSDAGQPSEPVVGRRRSADRVHTGTGIPRDRANGGIGAVDIVGTLVHRPVGHALLVAGDAVQGIERKGCPNAEAAGCRSEAIHVADSRLVFGGREEVAGLVIRKLVFDKCRGHDRVAVLDDLDVVVPGGVLVAGGDSEVPGVRRIGDPAGDELAGARLVPDERARLRPLKEEQCRRITGGRDDDIDDVARQDADGGDAVGSLPTSVAIPVDGGVAGGQAPGPGNRLLGNLPRRHPTLYDVPARVVGKLPGGRGRGHRGVGLRHAKDLVGPVVEPTNRVQHVGRCRCLPTFLDEPIRRVVDKRRDTAEPVGLPDLVADEVIGIRRGLAERIGLRDEPVPTVIRIAGDVARGIGHARGAADRVVGGHRRKPAGIRHRRATVEQVVAVGRHEPKRVGDRGEVANRIESVAGDGPVRADRRRGSRR